MNSELLPKVGRYDFLVEPFHCDFSNHLFWGHLGNAMLNAADYHSSERGYGVVELNKVHRTWVLSRFAVEMEDVPLAYDKLSIETWVESAKKFFTSRNFVVSSRDGSKVYGYGRSVWAMIDTVTRQPSDLLDVHDELIARYVETDKPCPIDSASRVVVSHDATFMREFKARYSDVDINGHINSVKYIEHVLDLFNIDFYRSNRLQRMEIAYVAEAHEGDDIRLYMHERNDGEYCVRMTKNANGEEEIVRCYFKFVKD